MPEFELGGMRVLPNERAVELNGERRELQPRVMQVLVALAQARPNVVSRERLIERCWGGRTVSDDAVNRCVLALRQLGNASSPAPFAIQTVPRVGHRLVENGNEHRDEPATREPDRPPPPSTRRTLLAVLAAVLVLAFAGVFLWQLRVGLPEPTAAALERSPTPWIQADRGGVAKSDAHNLYLTARGLLRTRSRRHGRAAVDLLQDAVKLDPGYAPAWASLAEAVQLDAGTRGYEGMVMAVPLAREHARRAIRLAPDLAEGHRVLARLLGFGHPEAQDHCRRAAELEPGNPESWMVLGVCHEAIGEFDRALADSRRAIELDPTWNIAVGRYSEMLAEMGDREEAEAIVRRGLAKDLAAQNIALARIALGFGDYSEAARLFTSNEVGTSPRWADPAKSFLNDARFGVGLPVEPLEPIPRPPDKPRRWRVLMDAAPPRSVWHARNRNPVAAQVYREDNLVAAKLMLNAGRARELAATYDHPVGLLGIRAGQPLRIDQISEAPIVALALQRSGRSSEAERLLEEADAAVRAVLRRSRAPLWFMADAAAVWAAQGRKEPALLMLEQATGRGWAHAFGSDLRELADEPALQLLKGHPRFEAISTRLRALIEREREQTARELQIGRQRNASAAVT